jgi:anhydro-N-acetylmuramic acid kinase
MGLRAIREKERRFAIGLMSGSSCDGIDAALVRLKGTGDQLRAKLIDHRTMRFPPTVRDRLLRSSMADEDLAGLDFILGQLFAEAANAVIANAKKREEPIEVDFIASHGHTVMHAPPRDGAEGYGTLQIGNASVIARLTGLPVAADFRPRDIAAGGQGAPLAAYADWILFRQKEEPVACLNIGGIANVTIATPKLSDVIAFDTGPGNMPIDGAIRHLTNGRLQFDKNGRRAARGKPIASMLDDLLDHPFFDEMPPKSTGREEFGFDEYLSPNINSDHDHTADDVVATVTEAVATSIVDAHERFVLPTYPVERIVVSGGGAHNRTLLKLLQDGLPEIKVYTSDGAGLPSDAREAIAFAILGNELFCGTASSVPSATGASKPVTLGSLTFP